MREHPVIDLPIFVLISPHDGALARRHESILDEIRRCLVAGEEHVVRVVSIPIETLFGNDFQLLIRSNPPCLIRLLRSRRLETKPRYPIGGHARGVGQPRRIEQFFGPRDLSRFLESQNSSTPVNVCIRHNHHLNPDLRRCQRKVKSGNTHRSGTRFEFKPCAKLQPGMFRREISRRKDYLRIQPPPPNGTPAKDTMIRREPLIDSVLRFEAQEMSLRAHDVGSRLSPLTLPGVGKVLHDRIPLPKLRNRNPATNPKKLRIRVNAPDVHTHGGGGEGVPHADDGADRAAHSEVSIGHDGNVGHPRKGSDVLDLLCGLRLDVGAIRLKHGVSLRRQGSAVNPYFAGRNL